MTIDQLDPIVRRRHKLLNIGQSALLLGGMLLLLSACGYVIAGSEGILWTFAIGLAGLAFAPRVSPRVVLALYGAVRVSRHELPGLIVVLEEIARRAGLERVPTLYYIASPTPNAFTVGDRREAGIALTDGLLRRLDLRELAGVLAHEISHMRNGDIWVMNLADMVSRLTGIMAMFGLLLLFVSLPLLIFDAASFPWLLVPLLFFAPTIGTLLQLALSRTRELDADLDAATLTGDPTGLARALRKLDRFEGGLWESILMPGRKRPDPSPLRSHPHTSERIRRLMALRRSRLPLPPAVLAEPLHVPYPDIAGRRGRRYSRFWY